MISVNCIVTLPYHYLKHQLDMFKLFLLFFFLFLYFFSFSLRRINIGQRYQAEVPELKERSAAQLDPHKAELVWAPLPELESKGQQQERGSSIQTQHTLFFHSGAF